ncbi:MAG: phosphotransferase [Chloroflexia bacterium]|jgi:homoserine kinase type II|nr:phosphotransferase [Chloroflexia bacterium]
MIGLTDSDILTHWALVPPLEVEPIATGTNNRSFLVKSGMHFCVLKWYRNVGNLERLRFEHKLLGALAAARLPFAVPTPLPTRTGDTTVEITHDRDVSRFALFQHIPGRAAAFGSSVETRRCGEALAILDQVLDALTLESTVPIPETFGDLSSIHPSVPDPRAAIEKVFREQALATALARIVKLAGERWQSCTSDWNAQLIHGDFYPTNTMMDSGEVSGILDFEFSGTGYRAMDFTIGLAAFSTKSWDDGCSWPLVESFAQGYLRRTPLAEEDLATVPILLLTREVTSLIHWLGRKEHGLTTVDDLHARARRLLSLDRWLEAHQTRLVDRLTRIACP